MPCKNGHFTPAKIVLMMVSCYCHIHDNERKGKLGGLWLSEANHGSVLLAVSLLFLNPFTYLQNELLLRVCKDSFGVWIWYQWFLHDAEKHTYDIGSPSCQKVTRPCHWGWGLSFRILSHIYRSRLGQWPNLEKNRVHKFERSIHEGFDLTFHKIIVFLFKAYVWYLYIFGSLPTPTYNHLTWIANEGWGYDDCF